MHSIISILIGIEYFALEFPVAPAIMVNDEIVVEGGNIEEEEVESCICRQLGIEKTDGPNLH